MGKILRWKIDAGSGNQTRRLMPDALSSEPPCSIASFRFSSVQMMICRFSGWTTSTSSSGASSAGWASSRKSRFVIFCSYRLSASGVFNLKSCRLIPKPVTRISVPSYQKLPCKLVHWVLQLLKYYLQWQIPKFMATVKVFTYRRCLKSLLSNSHKYSLLQSDIMQQFEII